MDDQDQSNDIHQDQQSTYFTMRPHGGAKQVGSKVIEVPDEGSLSPILRFELMIAMEGGISEDELQNFLIQRFKEAKPIKMDYNIVLDVTPPKLKNRNFGINLVWAPERQEWIGISHTEWLDATDWSNDFLFDGPFELDNKYRQIILDVYGVSEEDCPVNRVINTEPVKLIALNKKASSKNSND